MALKDEWKETGKSLGNAFKGLGKNVTRSVKSTLDDTDDSESNVFNDGSWRTTGKELGKAFKSLANSVVDSAKEGLDRLDAETGSENNAENNAENTTDNTTEEPGNE